jgi:hypothetical protein
MADTVSVSESERDRTVKALTRHCGDGRITLDELEERIERAFAAQTSAELHELVRDLPKDDLLAVTGVSPSPALQPHPSPTVPPRPVHHLRAPTKKAGEVALRVHATVFLAVMAMLVAIYLLTDAGGYFWPIWTAMPWGMALGIHAGVHKAIWAARDDDV